MIKNEWLVMSCDATQMLFIFIWKDGTLTYVAFQ